MLTRHWACVVYALFLLLLVCVCVSTFCQLVDKAEQPTARKNRDVKASNTCRQICTQSHTCMHAHTHTLQNTHIKIVFSDYILKHHIHPFWVFVVVVCLLFFFRFKKKCQERKKKRMLSDCVMFWQKARPHKMYSPLRVHAMLSGLQEMISAVHTSWRFNRVKWQLLDPERLCWNGLDCRQIPEIICSVVK